jgi:hypothetical protein
MRNLDVNIAIAFEIEYDFFASVVACRLVYTLRLQGFRFTSEHNNQDKGNTRNNVYFIRPLTL